MSSLLILLLILSLADLLYRRRIYAHQSVRHCILSALDALNVSADFLPYYDVKPYILSCLDEYGGKYGGTMQHEYERADGRVYYASPSSPVLFLFVCIGRYAVDCNNVRLRSYCDEHIECARRAECRPLW